MLPEQPPALEGATFRQLLSDLYSEHHRVCSENVALQAEVRRLLEPPARQPGGSDGGAGEKKQRAAKAPADGSQGLCDCASTSKKHIVSLDSEVSDEGAARPADDDSVEIMLERASTRISQREDGNALRADGRGLYFHDDALETATTRSIEYWEVAASARLPALPAIARTEIAPLGRSRSRLQEQIELQDAWLNVDLSDTFKMRQMSMSRSFSRRFAPEDSIRGGDTLREKNSCLQRFVTGPNSKRRVVWDVLSILILGYDILMVPMVAFEVPEILVLKVIDYLCTCFWTLDMPMSFFTGYHDAGILEMRPRAIARGYMRSWFCFDLLVISTDWLTVLTESVMGDLLGVLRISKAARMVRIFRLFRLLRLLKMPALLDELGDYIQSEHLFTAFGVMRSLTIIAIINHFIACIWYAIGQLGNPGWVERLDEESRTLGYRYATALHWSLTQFTPSSMEIHPRNVVERAFSICVLFAALVIFSSFVSSITNAMTQLHAANRFKGKQREDIRKYISDNKLSLELGNRIVAFVRKHRANGRKRVHEDEIQVLKVLPESVRLHLHWEVYQPVLLPHPLFYNINDADEGCMLDICHTAMGEVSLGSSQELFTLGQEAAKMSFVFSGLLEYYHGNSDLEMAEVRKGHWCSEAVLWVKWNHEGRLAAVSHCELVTLDASIFRKCVVQRPKMKAALQEYAQLFKKQLDGNLIDEPIDIWSDHDYLLEMAHSAFGKLVFEEPDGNPNNPKKRQWRPWRTLSLKRKKEPHVKFTKSSSMP